MARLKWIFLFAGLAVLCGVGTAVVLNYSRGVEGTEQDQGQDHESEDVSESSETASEAVPYVDVHLHLSLRTLTLTPDVFLSAAEKAIVFMDDRSIAKVLLLPPPFPDDLKMQDAVYDCNDFQEILSVYPDRFSFLCGGGTLNVMIQQAIHGELVSVDDFKAKARELAALPGFVGFGEMTALHFAMSSNHPFEEVPADHELFLALVDVAAEVGAPIDLHMEPVFEDMDFPELAEGSSVNPDRLIENFEAFKNLLTYAQDKGVAIIWDHLGWYHAGKVTPELVTGLLQKYDNLYFSIKISYFDSAVLEDFLEEDGSFQPEWLAVFEAYQEHFMIGGDHFEIEKVMPPAVSVWKVFEMLPEDLKNKMGGENAAQVFGLSFE